MRISIQDRHLIDRYLQGELSGIELETFNKRVQRDELFHREVELQQLLYEGIKLAGHGELRSKIFSAIGYSKPRLPIPLKMIIIFLIVTGIGISFWFYIGTETTNKDQVKSWLAFLNNKSAPSEDATPGPKETISQHQKSTVSHPVSQTTVENPEDEITMDTAMVVAGQEIQDSLPENRGENIIVKQDQLLISTFLKVEDKSLDTSSTTQESLANETAEKLNPAADLPVEEKPGRDYAVEFWVSPINYRGYKLSKNKLILFGIDAPDAVRLYRVNDILYMNYLDEYYKLTNSLDFLSYQKLKEAEIPLAIK